MIALNSSRGRIGMDFPEPPEQKVKETCNLYRPAVRERGRLLLRRSRAGITTPCIVAGYQIMSVFLQVVHRLKISLVTRYSVGSRCNI